MGVIVVVHSVGMRRPCALRALCDNTMHMLLQRSCDRVCSCSVHMHHKIVSVAVCLIVSCVCLVCVCCYWLFLLSLTARYCILLRLRSDILCRDITKYEVQVYEQLI